MTNWAAGMFAVARRAAVAEGAAAFDQDVKDGPRNTFVALAGAGRHASTKRVLAVAVATAAEAAKGSSVAAAAAAAASVWHFLI